MDNNISSVIGKVQKLLALSKSDNANEAAAASAAANKLIDQYRLSVADLEEQGQTAEPVNEDQDIVYQTGKVTRWKKALIHHLCDHYGVTFWNDAIYPQGRLFTRYRLVGRASDMSVVKYMFAWLTTECTRLSTLHGTGKGRVWIASYCDGFVNGIYQQLKASRQEIAAQHTSSALVKIDSRSEEANRYLEDLHPNLRFAKNYSRHHVDRHAYADGQERGKAVHLGQALPAAHKLLKG